MVTASGVPPSYSPSRALRAVYFNNIFDDPSADWAAGVELLLQLKTTGVAEAHVSAGVDHRVHLAVKADSAFPVLAACWLRRGEDRRDGGAQGGAGSSHCKGGGRNKVIQSPGRCTPDNVQHTRPQVNVLRLFLP